MNRSNSREKASPPLSSFLPPVRKTEEELKAQAEEIKNVDGVSETPLRKAIEAATGASKGKGKEKAAKPAPAPETPAPAARTIVYPWQKEGMNVEKVFSTRLPASLIAKMGFLAGMDSSLKIGKITAAALEPMVNALLKERGIEG